MAFTLAGFLNVIPSAVAQAMFAETSRAGVTLGVQLRKALRGTYGLLLLPLVLLMPGAPSRCACSVPRTRRRPRAACVSRS